MVKETSYSTLNCLHISSSIFNNSKHKQVASMKLVNNALPYISGNMVDTSPNGSPCFLLDGSFFSRLMKTSGYKMRNAPNGSLLLFGYFLTGRQHPLGATQIVSICS